MVDHKCIKLDVVKFHRLYRFKGTGDTMGRCFQSTCACRSVKRSLLSFLTGELFTCIMICFRLSDNKDLMEITENLLSGRPAGSAESVGQTLMNILNTDLIFDVFFWVFFPCDCRVFFLCHLECGGLCYLK